jgi:Zn-dependent peptidase ImmA (M78 family)
VQDFRGPVEQTSVREESILDTLTRDIVVRQQILREVLEDADEDTVLPFVGSASITDTPSSVADDIREVLQFTIEDQLAARDPSDLFDRLWRSAEDAGIYVLLAGDLGSHHTDIGEEIFRGFALADAVAPFIVINDNDAVPARSFTLIHELAHLWIGESGVSGSLDSITVNAIERFCNTVAGLFLIPFLGVEDDTLLRVDNIESALAATAIIANKWHVSQGVATYRLIAEHRISASTATQLFRVFSERWRAEKQRRFDDDRGGPTYYILRRHRLGTALLKVARRALQERILSYTRAARLLGVNPSAVGTLLRESARAA